MDDATRLARMKARLAPWLDQPFFTVIHDYEAKMRGQCDHVDAGMTLNDLSRRVTCDRCKDTIDPYDALRIYADSERRLVSTLAAIREAREAEARRRQNEQDRRPFRRAVTARVPVKDLHLKAEPIIGWILTLSPCGHSVKVDGDRTRHTATCHVCKTAAAKSA